MFIYILILAGLQNFAHAQEDNDMCIYMRPLYYVSIKIWILTANEKAQFSASNCNLDAFSPWPEVRREFPRCNRARWHAHITCIYPLQQHQCCINSPPRMFRSSVALLAGFISRFLRFDTEKRGYLTFFDFRKVVKALTSRHTLCRADASLGRQLQQGFARAAGGAVAVHDGCRFDFDFVQT